MPDLMADTRPPTVSRERWHTLSAPQRKAAVLGLSWSTQRMLTLKGSNTRTKH